MTESLRESTWRERQAASTAVSEALVYCIAKRKEYEAAQRAYNDALAEEGAAIERNIAAHKEKKES